MTVSIEADKDFDKIQHPFMIKSEQIGYKRDIPQHNKCHI